MEIEVDDLASMAQAASGNQPVTIEKLYKALGKLVGRHPDMVISLMSAPDYEDVVMTTALCSPQHGALYLIGEAPGDNDDIATEEAAPVEVAATSKPVEPEFDPAIAESA